MIAIKLKDGISSKNMNKFKSDLTSFTNRPHKLDNHQKKTQKLIFKLFFYFLCTKVVLRPRYSKKGDDKILIDEIFAELTRY